MIAAMVGAILVIVLALIAVWLVSPAFRTWSEQSKYRMLERNALYDHAGSQERQVADQLQKPETQTQ